jgi:squalene-hopene/tetraprenyl-beta-curcumene cyclase
VVHDLQSGCGTVKRLLLYSCALLVATVGVAALWSIAHFRVFAVPAANAYRNNWSPSAAASYLDGRETWWRNWPTAQLDHGTFCISCHTALPYAMARRVLRRDLGQTNLTAEESQLLTDIQERVSGWSKMKPYYTDVPHAAPSHATESILNAIILADYIDRDSLKPIAHEAFEEAWALQITNGADTGGWQWQDFHEAPWEAPESAYQGAALFAFAIGQYSDPKTDYPDYQKHVQLLREYLVRKYDNQPILNQVYVLWASGRFPGLLSESQRSDLLKRLANLQQADGGWTLSSLDRQTALKRSLLDVFKRASNSDVSDGCATGITVLALEEAGMDVKDPMVNRGLAWLESHQRREGSWWASSLNGFRNQYSETSLFMSDAATAYAVLALEKAGARGSVPIPSHKARLDRVGPAVNSLQ